MAEYLSIGPIDALTAAWLRDALIHDNLPGFDDLDDPEYFPYRFGHAAWAYLAGRYGDEIVGELFRLASAAGDPLPAVEKLTGTSIDELSAAWHASIRETYRPLDLTDVRPRGRALITDENGGGEINLGPALSPDGTRLVFLSEKSLLSIEMFLADAQTGEIIRKLTELATDPHLNNIQFLESTGAWAPDGRRFAYVGVSESTPVLVVIEGDSGDELREIAVSELGEIFNPTWSPDGRSIAFSGMLGGGSDLFVYHLDGGRLERLTDDAYAQIQPSWAPDGRSIAFVTDQFTTNLPNLDFGRYRLALYELATKQVQPLAGFQNAKHIDPQWAPDGRTLYFVADPNGIPNVFHLSLSNGAIQPVTNVTTAVTGITETTPALAVAAQTGALSYSVYQDGKYVIYSLEAADATSPVRVADVNAAVLPPATRGATEVAQVLRQPSLGLPPARVEFLSRPYDPNLALRHVGAAALTGMGVDQFGGFIGGGVTFLFSDMLNFHRVGATIEASGGVRDVAGRLAYLNQTSRWNWGGAVQRVPLRTGSFQQGLTEIDGQTVLVEQREIFRQIDTEISGIAEYPFSRASRLEFSGGLRRIGFDREVTTQFISPRTGALLDEQTRDLETAPAINLGQASMAFVYDNAALGPTSPLLGTRSRLELTPTIGDLRWTELLLDYRRYFSPVTPITIAGRALHFGRYGGGADDPRLPPLFVGYPNLVRGYDVDSFTLSECRADARFECPVFDQLLGTRLAVANLEVRAPIPGLLTGEVDYWPLPLEVFAFGDTGVAWDRGDDPSFLGGSRELVSSVGAGVRANVFGYLVTEFNAVRPLDRDGRGWMFVFNIRPGF
jgi:Tol biopolymer transport system component